MMDNRLNALRQGVRESLPEAAQIQDATLRDKVIEAWALSLSTSEFARIEEIPASGNPGSPAMTRGTQADHIRGVARLALAIAETMEAQFGALGINRDILLAAALCHDVGKPFEFSHRNQERWRADPRTAGYPALRHTLYGVHVALTVGLPEEVAHVAGTHSAEGQFVTRSLINTIVYHADHAFWDILGSAGLLQPLT
jgi:putative nucleotidyltransferase with HDIG domain